MMKFENVGSGMALLCAVHCLALPLVAGASCCAHDSPLANPALEGSMLGMTGLIGYGTLGLAFRRHRQPLPLLLLSGGLGGMILSHLALSGYTATAVTVIGAAAVVAGQWINRRLPDGACPYVCCMPEEGSEPCSARSTTAAG